MRKRNRRLFDTALCVVVMIALSVPGVFAQTSLSADKASYRPPVTARKYIVESNHPLASMAGLKILESGGNAVDAAVAVASALSVVEPACSNIFGGDAFIMIYSAKDKKVYVVNASGWAPTGATPDYYLAKGEMPSAGIDSFEIPGAFSGWMQALDRFGTKKPKELFKPAIDLCEKGVTVTPFYNFMIEYSVPILNEEARAIFMENGKAKQVGSVVYQPNLAKTFRDIGKAGSAAKAEKKFYKVYGKKLAEFSKGLGGLHTEADFADFRAEIVDPLKTNFQGLDVYACPPGCQGMALIEALNILEKYDIKALGHNTPEYINLVTEAFNLAFADRDKYCGDPRFVDIPIEGLTSKAYADKLRERIKQGSVNLKVVGGALKPEQYQETSGLKHENTTFFSVVDEEGNVVSCTTSIMGFFGSGLVAGDTGILLNDRMVYFWLDADHPNVVAPRKRTFQTITPSIALKDGKPLVVFGTPGSDVQEQTKLQILFNLVYFGMNPQQAVEAPRFRTLAFPAASYPHAAYEGLLSIESRVPEDVFKALSDMGYKVKKYPEWTIGVGGAGMIYIDPKTGSLIGGVDPRREGYVLGW